MEHQFCRPRQENESSKEDLIKIREDKLRWFADSLNGNGCLIGMRPPLTEWRCVGREAVMLLDTLLSDVEKQQKVDKILQIGWNVDLKAEQDREIIADLRESGTVGEVERLVEKFHRTETFLKRFEQLRDEMLRSEPKESRKMQLRTQGQREPSGKRVLP